MGIMDDLVNRVKDKMQEEIDLLSKGDGDDIHAKPQKSVDTSGTIGRKAYLDDPYLDDIDSHYVFKSKKMGISNKVLKNTSIRDWLVSTIIQHRADTLPRFSRPTHNKFDMGFEVVKKNQHEAISESEKEEIANLEDFIYHCGRKDKVPAGEEMLFGEYLKLTTRDALTFGHIATEKVLTRNGALHRFRPLPAESTYLIDQKISKEYLDQQIKSLKETFSLKTRGGMLPDPGQVVNNQKIKKPKYVQMSRENKVLEVFGDENMIFTLANPQNFMDSHGYCMSMLEQAILEVTSHLNVEAYNAQFFTHGYAARGILHLKGTVTPSQLTAFRRQFYNTISGTHNAWRTPIIAGLDDVEWVQISGTSKEMEYLSYNDHIMRSICSQFQIDPIELGLDQLTTGGKPISGQDGNETKVNFSRERGLYPLLMMFEDMVNNSIIPAIDPEFSKKYIFRFKGYTDETPQTAVAQAQAEMTTTATLNDLMTKMGKEKIPHLAADIPLNETFQQLLEKNLTRGEIREQFFGDEGASERPELQYIPGDPSFMGWQQLLMTKKAQDEQAKAEQAQAEQQQQQAEAEQAQQQAEHEHEKEMASKQDARDQERHELEMEEARARHAGAVADHMSLKELAKEKGAASEPLNIGGKSVANPINSDMADDT